MNLQPTLDNDLLLIRPLRKDDFEALFSVACDPLIWEQHPKQDRYKSSEFELFFQESLESEGALVIIDKVTGLVIGSSRYKIVRGVNKAVEIGWSFLSRKYWGGKYNGAMKQLMIDHALKTVDDVILYVGRTNFRSQKAVEKIGGKRITEPKEVMKNAPDSLTFRISKGGL